MATKIRLKRVGGKHDPHYRIVVADSRKKRDGRAVEELGYYCPKDEPATVEINAERVEHWLGNGAQPTETVRSLLVKTGVLEAPEGQEVEESEEQAAPAEEDAADVEEAEAADEEPEQAEEGAEDTEADEAAEESGEEAAEPDEA